jgi:DNA-binding CsgD family transcriptional regulator
MRLNKEDDEFKSNQSEQERYFRKAELIIKPNDATGVAGFYYYAKAWYMYQLKRHDESIRSVAKSVSIFYRLFQYRFLAQAYTLAFAVYSNEARKSRSYIAAFKAARSSERMRQMSDAYYKQLLKERIEAVEISFAIKEKKLNEKILQQQIEAMQREVQMTKLNLHEKIMVLDELKIYVTSLRKKELETRQLINTIAKKIDSVKITEEDKAVLQHKLTDRNKFLEQHLSSKYPILSSLEIRMCLLFASGLTNKELSKLFGQTEKAYEQHRYRIKKKMGLGSDKNLVKHLNALSNV